jgi:hypothetical protein
MQEGGCEWTWGMPEGGLKEKKFGKKGWAQGNLLLRTRVAKTRM